MKLKKSFKRSSNYSLSFLANHPTTVMASGRMIRSPVKHRNPTAAIPIVWDVGLSSSALVLVRTKVLVLRTSTYKLCFISWLNSFALSIMLTIVTTLGRQSVTVSLVLSLVISGFEVVGSSSFG